MGEKPLSIDEAPQQTAVAAGGPLEELDAPPAAAGTISTTRSNIKNQGAAAHDPATEAGTGAVAEEAVGTVHGPDVAGMAIKEQGVLKSTSTGQGPRQTGGTVKTGGNMATEGDPIPGIDVKLGKNPGGGAVGPVRPGPGPTDPGDPFPVGTGVPGGGAGGGGDAPAATNPLPGIDIIVKRDSDRRK